MISQAQQFIGGLLALVTHQDDHENVQMSHKTPGSVGLLRSLSKERDLEVSIFELELLKARQFANAKHSPTRL